MSEVPTILTRMCARFFEHTAPELVKQITRIADALERTPDAELEQTDEPETPDKENT